jgi:hypothetical protein
MAIVGDGYPGIQISRQNFADVQHAIRRLVDKLPEEGFSPSLVDSYWAKGAAIIICQDKETRDWLAARVHTQVAWEGSRLKMVSLDALPMYKRVMTWFLGPVKDLEHYFQWLCRLNEGLDTKHWRVYKHREQPNGVSLVFSIDMTFANALEGMG